MCQLDRSPAVKARTSLRPTRSASADRTLCFLGMAEILGGPPEYSSSTHSTPCYSFQSSPGVRSEGGRDAHAPLSVFCEDMAKGRQCKACSEGSVLDGPESQPDTTQFDL